MKTFKSDQQLLIGVILIGISFSLFLIVDPDSLPNREFLFSFLFFFNYSIPVIYVLLQWKAHGKTFWSLFGTKMYECHLLLLVLFNISAFSLNRELTVFYESADWLSALIVFENMLLVLLATLRHIPKWLRLVTIFLMPTFILFHLHQIAIVFPLIGFGLIGALFLGIGLLLLVPFFYMGVLLITIKRFQFKLPDVGLIAFGTLLPVLVLFFIFSSWKKLDSLIGDEYLGLDKPFNNHSLPAWIMVSRNLQDSYITEAYLKSNLVYQEYDFNSGFNNNYHEKRVHDPIISFCMGLPSEFSLDQKTRINILKFLYDKRHQTGERFWRGDHLTTDQIVTNIQIFPEERLAYTEMILTISNNDKRDWWAQQEEAVFTFQLPEGGVMTSLSLWIEGKEEKAILTTKSRAQTAYNTIVGRERRDPSVIYWMEGNKARIRVFPCTPSEKRKFKIGVTAPLGIASQKLHYQPVTFDGPDYSKAQASINLVTNGAKVNTKLPFNHEGLYLTWQGDYSPTSSFDIPLSEVKPVSFTFNDQTFVAKVSSPQMKSMDIKNVYLDITNHWEDDELAEVKRIFDGHNLLTIEGQPAILTETEPFPNFTLFPYHRLAPASNSIVITKGGMPTPNLEDLTGSAFKEELFAYFKESSSPILVLDFGRQPSNYNRSLKEFGVIGHYQVTLSQLSKFVTENKYPDPSPDNNKVDIARNGMSIVKENEASYSRGSDHLMRLFYYQAIMDQIGKKYFSSDDQDYIEEELTELAAIANVVTPISSLIVLETQKDYDRFDIEQNKNSLGNASIKNQGAVPEPHEWALIIAGSLFLLKVYFNRKRRLS